MTAAAAAAADAGLHQLRREIASENRFFVVVVRYSIKDVKRHGKQSSIVHR